MRRSLDYRSQSHSLLSTSPNSYTNLGAVNSGLGSIPRPCSRRGSFLYRTEVTDGGDLSPTQRSRQSSISANESGTDLPDALIVTPFAQLISSLRNIRDNHMMLHDIPQSRKSSLNQNTSPSAAATTTTTAKGTTTITATTTGTTTTKDECGKKKIAMDMLLEIDWCLEQLEGIQTLKSAGHVAARKFKRILTKELSQFSQFSKDGARLCDYIARTFLESRTWRDTIKTFSELFSLNHQSTSHCYNLQNITDSDDYNMENESQVETNKKDNECRIVQSNSSISPTSTLSRITCIKEQLPSNLEQDSAIPRFGVNVPDEKVLEKHLEDISEWGLDVFRLSDLSNNRPLTVITYKILQSSGLLRTFKISEHELISYLTQVENHYSSVNLYHNSTHAADVTQSVHVLLSVPSLQGVFSELEVLAAIFAACVHDVDHPGFTNQFLINTNAELAVMYNDESVLENHHSAVAFKILQIPGCDIFKNLLSKQRQTLRRMVIGMVLATDMSKHMDHIAHLKSMVEMYRLNTAATRHLRDQREDKIQILESMVHCADLSNPTKPLHLYHRWTDCITQEFFRQGDEEKRLGLPVSPMCDKERENVGRSQIGFIDYIVLPLWECWADLVRPDCQYILDTLEMNRQSHVIQEEGGDNDHPSFLAPKLNISPS